MLKPANIFYNFCCSVGHEEKDCRAYDLLQERTMDTYFMTGEEQQPVEKIQPQPQYTHSQYNQRQPQYNQSQLQYTQLQYNQQQTQ